MNTADYLGNTPLHLAASGPNAGIVEDLLGLGALVHVRNLAGETPISIAASREGYGEHVQRLQEAGGHL